MVVLEKQGTALLPKARGEAARLRKSIALNTWLLWSAWISFRRVEKAESDLVRGDMARGAIQMFDLFSPWLDADFEKKARKALNKELSRVDAVA